VTVLKLSPRFRKQLSDLELSLELRTIIAGISGLDD